MANMLFMLANFDKIFEANFFLESIGKLFDYIK